jgi:hypothetical protein
MTSILGIFEIAAGLILTIGARFAVALAVLLLLALPVVFVFYAVRGCEWLKDRILSSTNHAERTSALRT